MSNELPVEDICTEAYNQDDNSKSIVVEDIRTKAYNQDDNSKSIVAIKSTKLSEREIPDIQTIIHHRTYSENQIKSNVNYDDLCGPWIYPENPVYSQYTKPSDPSLSVWKYFTEEDLAYLRKHQLDKDAICSFFENKFLNENIRNSNDILTKILWEFFKFARLHSFTEKSISALLGIVYSTHLFFLSHPWRTAREVYLYFYKTVLLHVVLVCIVAIVFESIFIKHTPSALSVDSGYTLKFTEYLIIKLSTTFLFQYFY